MKEFVVLGALALGGAFAFGAIAESNVRPIGIEAAALRLDWMTFDEGMIDHLPVARSGTMQGRDHLLRWTFGAADAGGVPVVCTVVLSPREDQRTRIDPDCAALRASDDPQTMGAAAKLIELVFEEHVAAALEARPLDQEAIGRKVSGFMLTTGAAIAIRDARREKLTPPPAEPR